MTGYGHFLIDVKDKVTKKYHPIRFYMMSTDMPRILISHAASYWLGLVKVLCDNKAPRVKRQVASIDKKSDFRAKSSPFRTSTSNTGSSSQKKQTISKMVTSEKVHVPSPRVHSFEDTKIQGGKRCIGSRSDGEVDVSDGEQHSLEEPSATTGKELKTSKTGNSVLSGPNKKITDNVKDGPFRKHTAGSSNAKLGPKRKHTSKEAPCRKYYMPSNDTKTFQINNKGHLQCHQDPNLIHKPNDKGKLPDSREAPIYHEPGTVSCKTMEDLKKLYPNSFDRVGSLKGAVQHQSGPYSEASNTCQKGGTNRIKGGNRQGAGLPDRRGNHHGASRAKTMGLFSDLSHEAEWRSKGMSGSKKLEQGHHQRAP